MIKRGLGIDLNRCTSFRYTALHIAVDAELEELVAVLLEQGADTEAETDDTRIMGAYEPGGRTPLHLAAIRGSPDMCRMLLEADAQLGHRDWQGRTPLDLSILHDNIPVVQLFLSAQAIAHKQEGPVDDQKKEGTALKWVSKAQKQAVLRQDRQAAKARALRRLKPTGELWKIGIIPKIWTSDECLRVLEAVKAHAKEAGWSKQRHGAYATTDIPSSAVSAIDPWVRQSLRERLLPALARQYTYGPGWGSLDFRDLFYVKYEGSMESTEQSGLDIHQDGSIISFNILLNRNHEFKGGGTYFEHLDKTITIEQGDACHHSGLVYHGGQAITEGLRIILVGFIDIKCQSFACVPNSAMKKEVVCVVSKEENSKSL